MKNKEEIKLIIPIGGLGWLPAEIKLSTKVKIRNLDELNEENELLEQSGFNLIKYKCVLVIDYSYNAELSDEPYPALQFLLNKIQVALRLYSADSICLAGVISQPKVSPFPLLLNLSTPTTSIVKLEEFPQFFEKVAVAYEKLPIAFDSFNRSQERFANNDAAIDHCTLLESLFVPQESRGSKKPFVLQGLRILGFTKKDRGQIADLYDYRNAIIHANQKKILKFLSGAKYTYSWFEQCINLIRKVMRKYVEKPW